MNLISKRVRGMQDLLPNESRNYETLGKIMREESESYGFKLIRTPVLEQTELFDRSVGDSSDVVEKEMYTFEDKGGRSVTLRPEGTSGVLRAVLENGLHNSVLPLKLMYESSCYRYEKPQSGRYREFFQFGLEIFGTESYLADVELICTAKAILGRVRIRDASLEINSIGCPECRKKYNQALKEYFEAKKEGLCETCKSRLARNPLRIFDCKSSDCKKVCENAPVILDYICDECSTHFENVKATLNTLGIIYTVNPYIVRGLDYYSKTVFEFVCEVNGENITVCGGGRYDGLSKIIGGPDLPAIGFGIGLERVMMVMKDREINFDPPQNIEIFVASVGERAQREAVKICEVMRRSGISCECDISGKNLKSQMKYANKINATFAVVLGDEELENRRARIKEMAHGKETDIPLTKEGFIKFLISAQVSLLE